MKSFIEYLMEDMGVAASPTNSVKGVAGLGAPPDGPVIDPKKQKPRIARRPRSIIFPGKKDGSPIVNITKPGGHY